MKREELPLGISVQPAKILGSCCYVICDKQIDDSVWFLTRPYFWTSVIFQAESYARKQDAINRVKNLRRGR